MIVHISADRVHRGVVSIPRDTLVDILSCTIPDGTTTAPQVGAMFNSAFLTASATGDIGAASRYSTAHGSDISRIGRQQDIVMEIIDEPLNSNLLGDPIRLTAHGFGNIPGLIGLASSMTGLEKDAITMVTMSFDYADPRVLENCTREDAS